MKLESLARLLGRNYRRYGGSRIPFPGMRLCGSEYQDDHYFVWSAEQDALQAERLCRLSADTRILEIGCGPGRFAIGLLRVIGEIKYVGIDVDPEAISWCVANIWRYHRSFHFLRLDTENQRYNPSGSRIGTFTLPFRDATLDVVYLYAVFTNMEFSHVERHLEEIHRVLVPRGEVFLTAYMAEDVPDVVVNPADHPLHPSGPLHLVRYRKDFFFDMVRQQGFGIHHFLQTREGHGHHAVCAAKAGK